MSEKKALVSIVVDGKWVATDVMEPFDVPTGEYHVTVGGRPWNEWCRALAWCDAAHDGTSIRIEVVQKPQIQVHVKTLTGGTMTFVVCSTWTVGKLKTLVQDRDGVPCDQQWIYIEKLFGYVRLEDGQTLAECGVKDQSTLYLKLHLRGGKPVILFIPPSSGPHASTSHL